MRHRSESSPQSTANAPSMKSCGGSQERLATSEHAGLSSSSGNTIRSCSMRQAHIDLSVSHWVGADIDTRGEAKDAANLETDHHSPCEHYRNCVRAACGLCAGRVRPRRIPVF